MFAITFYTSCFAGCSTAPAGGAAATATDRKREWRGLGIGGENSVRVGQRPPNAMHPGPFTVTDNGRGPPTASIARQVASAERLTTKLKALVKELTTYVVDG
jgi:hypothetical protein